MTQKIVTVTNKLGLHARPSALLVRAATKYRSEFFIEKDGMKINGKSIMGVMMLAAGIGSQVTLETDGEKELEASDAILALINDKLGEGE